MTHEAKRGSTQSYPTCRYAVLPRSILNNTTWPMHVTVYKDAMITIPIFSRFKIKWSTWCLRGAVYCRNQWFSVLRIDSGSIASRKIFRDHVGNQLESAKFDSESSRAALVSKIQKNHRKSSRIAEKHSESLRFRARSSESSQLSLGSTRQNLSEYAVSCASAQAFELCWFSADITGKR